MSYLPHKKAQNDNHPDVFIYRDGKVSNSFVFIAKTQAALAFLQNHTDGVWLTKSALYVEAKHFVDLVMMLMENGFSCDGEG